MKTFILMLILFVVPSMAMAGDIRDTLSGSEQLSILEEAEVLVRERLLKETSVCNALPIENESEAALWFMCWGNEYFYKTREAHANQVIFLLQAALAMGGNNPEIAGYENVQPFVDEGKVGIRNAELQASKEVLQRRRNVLLFMFCTTLNTEKKTACFTSITTDWDKF